MNPRFLFVLLAVISMGLGPQAYTETTASLSVTTTEDRVDADGCTRSDCTLREAILAANAIGRGTIHIELMEGTYTLSLPNASPEGEDDGATGDLDLRSNIELIRSPDANPSTPTIIEGSRGLADRVIDIVAPRPTPDTTRPIRVLIQGITIQKGSLGGIRVGFDTTLTMEDSRIEKNEGFFGGLVNNAGTCSLRQVTIHRNRTTSPLGGGGILNGGSLTLDQVTISENTALIGGGLTNYLMPPASPATASLTNVTISGNRATELGAGIANIGTLNLLNVTIVANVVNAELGGHGGGVVNFSPSGSVTPVVNVRNSLIAGNTDTYPDPREIRGSMYEQSPDCFGTLTSQGRNIIQDQRGCSGLVASDIGGDPRLVALGDNGGTTQTHALGAGSLAVNAGDSAACERMDQREMPRRSGFCDIGAFQAQPAAIAVEAGSGQSARSGAGFATPLRVRVRDVAGNPLGGVDISLTAPSSGASTSLSAVRATTNADGIVSVNATANSTAGTYTVTATIDGTTTSAGLNLTNTAAESVSPPPPPVAPPTADPAPAVPTPEVGESDEPEAPETPEAPVSPTAGGGGCGCNMTSPADQSFSSQAACIALFAFTCLLMAFRRGFLRSKSCMDQNGQ